MSSVLRTIRQSRRPRRPSRPPWWRVAAPFAGAAVLAGVAIWSVWALVHAPFLSVRTIEVAGTERLDAQEVRDLLAPLVGRPTLLVPLGQARSRLAALPQLADAVVARRLPDLIEVHVVERVAVARVPFGHGAVLLADRDGALFAPGRGRADDAALPTLHGVVTAPGAARLDPRDRAGLRALAALRAAADGPLPPGVVVDVTYDDRIELRLGPGAPAIRLDRQHPETNLAALFAWRETVAELAPGRPVDLRFGNRLTVLPSGADTARR
ncbi:MAG: hypothetical protein Kow0062_24280 [Acidobacteriota bacterium]|nr:MAG: FtsQ-type POTRA domain-containing protein [Acidobacteriota bacterium]